MSLRHKEKESSETLPTWKLPYYGMKPFVRSVPFIALLSIFAITSILLLGDKGVFLNPSSLTKGDLFWWLLTSLLAPHAFVFFTTYVAGLSVLSLKKSDYVIWLIKNSIPGAVISFLVLELTIFFTLLMIIVQTSEYQLKYNEMVGMSSVESLFWGMSIYSISVVFWVAYRVSWSAYRQIGAQTMQERAHEYEEKLKVKNSGQFWEKYVERPYKKLSGSDGHKPRGGFLFFFIISPLVTIITFYLGLNYFSSESYLPFMVLMMGVTTMGFMSVRKYIDTLKPSKLPRLIPVRDSNTVDVYHPEDSAIQSFS